MYSGVCGKMQVKIIDSFFYDIIPGKTYKVLDKPGLWIVTEHDHEFNLIGKYNNENYVVEYEIVK